MATTDLEWAIGFWKDRAKDYKRYRAYYDGQHPLLFATEKFRNVFGPLFLEFADNLCPTVVDVPADRLRIDGWDGKGAAKAQELYDDPLCSLRRTLNQSFKDAGCVGDSYILVWPDDDEDSDTFGEPQFWPHDADQMCVRYSEDNPNRIEVAAKQWVTREGKGRVNLYYEDKIQKWVTNKKLTSMILPAKESSWARLGGEKDSGEYDNDYGMPVFHFGKNARVGGYGKSALHDVIPLQDGLNKSMCDMFVDMEFIAYPQRWATGLQVEVNEETGKPIKPPFTPGVDRIWSAAEGVNFGEFSVGDLTQFTGVQESIRAEIARVSGLPTHYLNLDSIIPVGEGLRVCEARMIAGLIQDQDAYTSTVVRVMQQALKIKGGASDKPKFKPVWADPNPHNPMLDAETQVVKQSAGVSKKQSLRELRYTDEQITEFEKDNDAEAEKKQKAALALGAGGGKGVPGQPAGPGEVKGKSGQGAVAPQGSTFQRNGGPGKASKPAARQQQRRRPVGSPQ